MLKQIHSLCLDSIQERRLDYRYLATFIANVPESKFKQRLVGIFYHICIISEAETSEDPERVKSILKHLSGELLDRRLVGVLK